MIAMGICGCIRSPSDNLAPEAVLRSLPTARRALQADIRHNGVDADARMTRTIVQTIYPPWDEMIACATCVSGDRSTEALRSFRIDVEKT